MELKKILILAFILNSLLAVGQINSEALEQRLSGLLDSFPNKTYLSIGLIKGDSVRYVGLYKKDSLVLTMNLEDSLFEIGSLTKVFTTTVLATQLQQARLAPEDHINDQFEFEFHDQVKLNYMSLANHTSGLPRLPSNAWALFFKSPTNPYQHYNYELLDEYMRAEMEVEISDEPTYAYSNLGMGILAYSLCKKEKLDFEALLKRDILEPFEMNRTSFNLKTFITGFNMDGSKLDNWEFNALQGAGGLISCTSDLIKFVQAQFDPSNEILQLTRKITYVKSDKFSIGLGWHVLKPESEKEKYWHNGGTGGFTSSIAFRTVNKTGVVVLSNLSALNKMAPQIDKICFELLNILE